MCACVCEGVCVCCRSVRLPQHTHGHEVLSAHTDWTTDCPSHSSTVFLLVPAYPQRDLLVALRYPGSSGSKVVKQLCVCVVCNSARVHEVLSSHTVWLTNCLSHGSSLFYQLLNETYLLRWHKVLLTLSVMNLLAFQHFFVSFHYFFWSYFWFFTFGSAGFHQLLSTCKNSLSCRASLCLYLCFLLSGVVCSGRSHVVVWRFYCSLWRLRRRHCACYIQRGALNG